MSSPFCLPSPVAEMVSARKVVSPEPGAVEVEIQAQSFEPWRRLEQWCVGAAAHAVFLGSVRSEDQLGVPLDALELVHYPGMCERRIHDDAERIRQAHGADRVLVLHRVGRLPPGEPIVLVAVSADRRGAAQRCCSAVLEALKHDAPFWKREWRGGEGVWLAGNTPL